MAGSKSGYKVWDTLNGERADAREIEACDAKEAAEIFAELDVSGRDDGLYYGSPQPICVLDGEVERVFQVKIELEPTYHAWEQT